MAGYVLPLKNEQELINQVQHGNSAAFGSLYDHYIRSVYEFVYNKTHNKEVAEDVTSSIFFKALRSIQSIDSSKPLGPWLYKVARNTIIDHYRTAHPYQDISDAWDISDDKVNIIDEVDLAFRSHKLKPFLARLSEEQRTVLMLRIWEEKSYKEIAEIIGKTEGNSKVIFSRALDALRKIMPPSLFAALLARMFS